MPTTTLPTPAECDEKLLSALDTLADSYLEASRWLDVSTAGPNSRRHIRVRLDRIAEMTAEARRAVPLRPPQRVR